MLNQELNKENKKSVTGSKTLRILEEIEEGSNHALAVFIAVSSSLSYPEMQRNYNKAMENLSSGTIKEIVDDFQEWRKFNSLLSHLKKNGLVAGKNSKLKSTNKGRAKAVKLRKRIILNKKYNLELSKDLIVFIYDIPERYRKERSWVRRTLQNLGYTMKQKSVWVGEIKLPRDFIKDLRKLKLTPYFDFFTVVDEGTLKS